MSYYPLLPHPCYDCEDYATWEDGFTSDECDRIIHLGESIDAQNSSVHGQDEQHTDYNIRKSLNSWITLNSDTEWLYERLGNISRCLNGMNWKYDISGFSEELQYTRYNDDKCYYGWHIDSGVVRTDHPARKLSLTLQLSDENEYEGGDFEIHATKLHTLPKKKGLVIAFHSHSLHQVTPVTKGIRRSLVVWLCGPPLR